MNQVDLEGTVLGTSIFKEGIELLVESRQTRPQKGGGLRTVKSKDTVRVFGSGADAARKLRPGDTVRIMGRLENGVVIARHILQ